MNVICLATFVTPSFCRGETNRVETGDLLIEVDHQTLLNRPLFSVLCFGTSQSQRWRTQRPSSATEKHICIISNWLQSQVKSQPVRPLVRLDLRRWEFGEANKHHHANRGGGFQECTACSQQDSKAAAITHS